MLEMTYLLIFRPSPVTSLYSLTYSDIAVAVRRSVDFSLSEQSSPSPDE